MRASARTRGVRLGLWALLLGATAALGQTDAKIAYVNSERILEGYIGTKTAMETFRRDVDGWNQDALARKQELDQIGKELEQQSPMLSDEKRREREQEYQRKLTEYDQFVQGIWGPNGLVVQRNEEILRPIITKVQTILAAIAADEQYDLILDAADGNVLYGSESLDLTQRVIDELNAQEQ